MTKVKPPKVLYAGTAAAPHAGNSTSVRDRAHCRLNHVAQQAPPNDVPRLVITQDSASVPEAEAAPIFPPINDECTCVLNSRQ
jgi:hypothetical protein